MSVPQAPDAQPAETSGDAGNGAMPRRELVGRLARAAVVPAVVAVVAATTQPAFSTD